MIYITFDHEDAIGMINILDHVIENSYGPTQILAYKMRDQIKTKIDDEE